MLSGVLRSAKRSSVRSRSIPTLCVSSDVCGVGNCSRSRRTWHYSKQRRLGGSQSEGNYPTSRKGGEKWGTRAASSSTKLTALQVDGIGILRLRCHALCERQLRSG